MKPRTFWLHVHYLTDPHKRVWGIQMGQDYFTFTHITVNVPLETVFRGINSRQPKAFLRGKGILKIKGSRAVIS